jgi:hypothetical protein
MEQEPKPKRQLTPEQLEALKARLLKAREAKMARDTKRYDANKEQIKEEGLKKRTMNKIKTLVSKGAVKEEELKDILPKKEEETPINKVVEEAVKEVPFEKPLPTKRVPKIKPQPQPAVIPFEEELPPPRGTGWKYKSTPIDIPPKPEKNRFLKLVYYKEPSKKALKKLQKLQESSSSSSGEDSDSEPEFQHIPPQGRKQQVNKAALDDDAYYRALAKKLYGGM